MVRNTRRKGLEEGRGQLFTDDEGEEYTELDFEEEIAQALEMLEGDDSANAFYEDNHHIVEEYKATNVFTRVYDWWTGF